MPTCQPAIVLTTCPSQAEAERIGKLLLQQHLAVCVQYESCCCPYPAAQKATWNGWTTTSRHDPANLNQPLIHYCRRSKATWNISSAEPAFRLMSRIASIRHCKAYEGWMGQRLSYNTSTFAIVFRLLFIPAAASYTTHPKPMKPRGLSQWFYTPATLFSAMYQAADSGGHIFRQLPAEAAVSTCWFAAKPTAKAGTRRQ